MMLQLGASSRPSAPRPSPLANRTFTSLFFLLLPLILAAATRSASPSAAGKGGRVEATSGSFRFAWLSDTHVGSETGEEDLRAAVRDINSITGLSFVVISGDVTEYGSLEQLRLAKQILSGLKIPSHVIPGNHDTKWSESGATDFPRLWKEDRFVFEHGGFRFIGLHEGPIMKMGDGHWAPQDVRWLEMTLKKMPDKNQPIVFVTHYPIDNGIANWFVVLDLLKQYNLQVALCGHIHRNSTNSFEGVLGVMGRSNLRAEAQSSAGVSPAGPPAVGGFNLVTVEDGKMTFAEHLHGHPTRPPWHSLRLQKPDYAADTNKYPRPDFSINARYPKVHERWSFDTGFTIASSPAVWKGLAIVGNALGVVYGISVKSGSVEWKLKTGNAVYSTPDVSGDLVVVPSTDGNVYARSAATGQEIWRYRTDRPIVASPGIADGVVYLGSSEGKFRAFDLASGKLLWQFDGLRGFVEAKPLIYGGKVIFGAWDEHLYALDAKTGRLAWKWKGDKRGTLFSPAACWPVAARGRIFIATPDRKLSAIAAKDGRQLWRTGDYVARETLGLSLDQTRLYVRSMQDFIYAFSTSTPQPEKFWECNAGFGYDINSAMIVEKDGVVFYGTKNGLLLALHARTGALKWQHKVGVSVVNTLMPLSSSQVLATEFDGKIALIESKD